MIIHSLSIARLRNLLRLACRYYGVACLDSLNLDRNPNIINFTASWFETWAFICDDIDFRDVAADPNTALKIVAMHSEVFKLARNGMYIYTALDREKVLKVAKKLKLLNGYRNRFIFNRR